MKSIPLVRISLVLMVAMIAAAAIKAQEKPSGLPSLYKPAGRGTTFTPDQATMPETAAFAYMRRMSSGSLLSTD